MTYVKQTWIPGHGSGHVSGETPLTAQRMGHIEDGIESAASHAVNVHDYGAVGDGVTDDTAAIQSALDAAAAAKQSVWLPPGTYRVVPVAGSGVSTIVLKSGLRGIRGTSASIVKVTDGAVPYYTLFGNVGGGTQDVGGLVLDGFTIDQNTTGNSWTAAETEWNTRPRFVIRVTNNTRPITICGLSLLDMDNTNSIILSGGDHTVENCYLKWGTAVFDHDSSAIWTRTDTTANAKSRIVGNVVETLGAGAVGARCAIETHGGAQVVQGNVVRGWRIGINPTGIALRGNEAIIVAGNIIHGAATGIKLWSGPWQTNSTVGLRGAIIRDNIIRLNGPAWAALTGSGQANGIMRDSSSVSDLPVEDVLIADNDIDFDQTGYTSQATDTACNGVEWYRGDDVVDKRVTIRGNRISNAGSNGIRLSVIGEQWRVDENTIRNPGRGSVAAGGLIPNSLANGVMVNRFMTDSSIDRNVILDDQGTPTMGIGVYVLPGSTGTSRCRIFDNTVTNATTRPIDVFQATYSAPWQVRHSGTGNPIGVIRAPMGSLYQRQDAGATSLLYVKETGNDVAGWTPLTTRARVASTASSGTPAPDANAVDQYAVTALAANTTLGAPTGTPVDGQRLTWRIKDNGTARTIGYNAIYRAVGVTLPTTTVASKTLYLDMVYNSADTKWDVIDVRQEA